MRRVVMALLGTAIGTTLLVGLKAQGTPVGPAPVATAPVGPAAPDHRGATGSVTATGRAAASGAATAGRGAGGSTSSTTAKGPTPAETTASPTARAIIGAAVPAKDFGDVQLKVIMTGSHIDDIVVLQMSNRPLNAPTLLRQEALAKQDANLTNVSGATYTSQAYMRSLQSALDQA